MAIRKSRFLKMMFGGWLIFDPNKKFLLKNDSFVQIFKKKHCFPKRVAKVGFFYAEKKAWTNKYLLIIGEAQAMFGKYEMQKPTSEFYF